MIRKAANYAKALALSLLATALSLYGALCGPNWLWYFGLAAFLLVFRVLVLSRQPLGLRFLQFCPYGLSVPFPRLRALKAPIEFLIKLAALCAAIFLVTMFTAGSKGVGDGKPTLATREHYVLTNHSRRTEVSRLRYCLADSALAGGWHFGVAFRCLIAMHALFFGALATTKLFARKNT